MVIHALFVEDRAHATYTKRSKTAHLVRDTLLNGNANIHTFDKKNISIVAQYLQQLFELDAHEEWHHSNVQ